MKLEIFDNKELFKIHLCTMLCETFTFFPDIYNIELKIKNKFDKPSFDIYPKIFVSPQQQLVKTLSTHSGYVHSMHHFNTMLHNANLSRLDSHSPGLTRADFLINWSDNPQQCIFSLKYDFCNYLEFVEYLIFSLREFDKQEIDEYIQPENEQLLNRSHHFSRARFEQDKNTYLGAEILIKQERQALSQTLETLELPDCAQNKGSDKI